MNLDQRRQIKVLKRRAKLRARKDSTNKLLSNHPVAHKNHEHFVRVFADGKAGYLRARNHIAPAPWLPASPVVDGVRMRYAKGKLVPRTR